MTPHPTPPLTGLRDPGGMMGLQPHLATTVPPKALLHLVKLPAGRLDGRSSRVDLHSREAVAGGESLGQPAATAAWRESPYFTDAERAALDLTEAGTALDRAGVPDAVGDPAAAHSASDGRVALLMAIVAISAWNRLTMALRTVPTPRTHTATGVDPPRRMASAHRQPRVVHRVADSGPGHLPTD